jgi:hypothetical protein
MARTLHGWTSFLFTADDFIISYAQVSGVVAPTTELFLVGHAVELYLKAASTKLSGDINRTVNFGHGLYGLWKDCKHQDANFMAGYDIIQSTFDRMYFTPKALLRMSKSERMNYIINQNFYIILKYLPDLKYAGAPLRILKGPYSMGTVSHDPYWIKFFAEIRTFLGFPSPTINHSIKLAVGSGTLTKTAEDYLTPLA